MYASSKIYKIVDVGYNDAYFGSTVQHLSVRMAEHRKNFKTYQAGGKKYMSSFFLFEKYGVENCKIELVEEVECKSREELRKIEGEYIKNNQCVNKCVAGRTKQEWNEDNKEKIKLQNKQRYEANKEKFKEYYLKNKEKIRQNYLDHKEKKSQIQ